MWEIINSSPGLFTGALTIITLAASAIRYFHLQTRESNNRQFEEYHKLIENLVGTGDLNAIYMVERIMAIIFELRNFPRYYQFTIRVLTDLKNLWEPRSHLASDDPSYIDPAFLMRLEREVDYTIKFIKDKRCWFFLKCYHPEKI